MGKKGNRGRKKGRGELFILLSVSAMTDGGQKRSAHYYLSGGGLSQSPLFDNTRSFLVQPAPAAELQLLLPAPLAPTGLFVSFSLQNPTTQTTHWVVFFFTASHHLPLLSLSLSLARRRSRLLLETLDRRREGGRRMGGWMI